MSKELDSNLFKCICDQHANHVVQKCMECVQPQYIQFIYRRLCGKAKMLSTHPYGCHVVQVKMLEFCKDPQIMDRFITEILDCVKELSIDPYGNYVVQGMIIHQYANCVVRQLIDVVNDWQFNVMLDVLRRNRETFVMYAQGRQVIAQVKRLLNGMAPSPDSFGSQFL
uniref:Pumilio-like protein n=2 Tax=Aegilops tauschii TaxID=37682 RepID=N1QXL4_AEGTA